MMGFGGIFGILLIVVIVWVIIQLTGKSGFNPFTTNWQQQVVKKEDAVDILKKRYARGEINKDEYERIKEKVS